MIEKSTDIDVSIIVPTYCEADNLSILLPLIKEVFFQQNWNGEVLIMDDMSPDDTVDRVASFNHEWVRLVIRDKNPGLSASVIDGFALARGRKIVVMDADLSHPPDRIPAMVESLERADFVIGSRYVPGASTPSDWGMFRQLNSLIALYLSKPLIPVSDSMSGFFALTKKTLQNAPSLNPVGFKIGLELIVKCNLKNITEIPIDFSNRKQGESKLSLRQ